MGEYIKREAAMEIFGDIPMWQGYYEPYPWEVHCALVGVVKLVKEEISKIPAADVEPVVHGHFVHDGSRIAHGVDWWHCSNCGRLASGVETRFNYCPWCGARMDGGSDG